MSKVKVKVTKKELAKFIRTAGIDQPDYLGKDPKNPRRWLVAWGSEEYRGKTLADACDRIYRRGSKSHMSPAQLLADRGAYRALGVIKHKHNIAAARAARFVEVGP